jgi:hypothetical protein
VAGLLALVTTLLVTIAVGASVSAARLAANLQRAEGAERVALKNLWGSYLAQARAGRYSGRPGQRFDGLETLARAARLGVFPGRRGELRDEAIACLALADLRPSRPLEGRSLDEYRVAFDADFERYAVSDADCNVSLRRVADGVEVARRHDGVTAEHHLARLPEELDRGLRIVPRRPRMHGEDPAVGGPVDELGAAVAVDVADRGHGEDPLAERLRPALRL